MSVSLRKAPRRDYGVLHVCNFCGNSETIYVNEADLIGWQMGDLVQHAFPYLTAQQREWWVSGLCSECWDALTADCKAGDFT